MKKIEFDPNDLVGKKIGHLTVLNLNPEKKIYKHSKRYQYDCQCDCGRFCTVTRDYLKRKNCEQTCEKCALKKIGDKKCKDLTGKRFGKLVVKEKLQKRRGGRRIVYLCHCDCGNDVEVRGEDLTQGKTRSCGCLRKEILYWNHGHNVGDIQNQWEFLKLLKIENHKGKKRYLWRCKCVCCGEERDVYSDSIDKALCKSRKKENKKLLEKFKKEKKTIPVPDFMEDITGQRYGKLIAIGYVGTILGKHYWLFQCDCGTIKVIRMCGVLSGAVVSCGCYHKEKIRKRAKDLTGMKFGKLTVLQKSEKKYLNSHFPFWECQCECGNKVVARAGSLIAGNTQSCGCLRSKGEFIIAKFLNEHGIYYEPQFSFKNCKDKSLLKFDFQIFYPNSQSFFLCEYQGQQHYRPIKFNVNWSEEETELNYQNGIKRDQIKRDYCKDNNIKLLEIPYWDFKNIETILIKELNLERKEGKIIE